MEALLHQVLAGLATGGIYASLALALVMIYQATHLVNFAQGEMAMFTTYIAWTLIENHGWSYWPAFIATLIFAFVAYMIIGLLTGQPNLAILCALLIGALLGFLWFNVHPAQVIMGDSGSLALGSTLAVTALITGQILVLPLIGLIFVVETASVVIQVAYFKLSGGKRIFKMSPIHHHFELSGWDEEKITLRFWIVGILAGLLGVVLFLASIDRLQ